MGKAVSKISTVVAAPIAIVNPIVGLALCAAGSVSAIEQADRQRKKLNTELDIKLRAEEQALISVEQQLKQTDLEEIQKMYVYMCEKLDKEKGAWENYYEVIKHQLEKENFTIEHLNEVLQLMDKCARGKLEASMLEQLELHKHNILTLCHWGLLHVLILSGEPDFYNEMVKIGWGRIDLNILDHMGHSIAEYAQLLGDQKLIASLEANERIRKIYEQEAKARMFLQDKGIDWQEKQLSILDCDDETAQALITMEAIPLSGDGYQLVSSLADLGKHKLLWQLLDGNTEYLSDENLETIRHKMPETVDLYHELHYGQERCGKILETYQWLWRQGFSRIDEVNSQQQTPLHVAVIFGNLPVMKNLLRFGADPKQIDKDGNSILMLAVIYNKSNIIQYLKDYLPEKCMFLHFNRKHQNVLSLFDNVGDSQRLKLYINKRFLAKQERLGYFIAGSSDSSVVRFAKDFYKQGNILMQAGKMLNMWRKELVSAHDIRLPVVLSFYALGVDKVLPWGKDELWWLVDRLKLRIKYIENDVTEHFGKETAVEIVVTFQDGKYSAHWEDKSLTLSEPQITKYQPMLADVGLKAVENCSDSAKQYIKSSCDYTKNIALNSKWGNYNFHQDLGRKEKQDSAVILGKLEDETWHYPMPYRDAGYHAIGIPRTVVAKFLMGDLSRTNKKYISVEWTSWIMGFKYFNDLPIDDLALKELFDNYKKLDIIFQKDPNESNKLKLKGAINNLYEYGQQDAICLQYLADFVAAPHNHLNPLRYCPETEFLPQGGILAAISSQRKFGVEVFVLNNGEPQSVFKAGHSMRKKDILQHSPIIGYLENVSILSKRKMELKPVVTHADLFSSPANEKNTDLAAILHGWFESMVHQKGIIPQTDLLALLIMVRASLDGKSLNEVELAKKVGEIRSEFSQEIIDSWGKLLASSSQLQPAVEQQFNLADRRVRNLAREQLLSSYKDVDLKYQEQVSALQDNWQKDFSRKLHELETWHTEKTKEYENNQVKLSNWKTEEEHRVGTYHDGRIQQIRNETNASLAAGHAQIKKQSRRGIRGVIVDAIATVIQVKCPVPKTASTSSVMVRAAATTSLVSAAKGQGLNPRGAAVSALTAGIQREIISNIELSDELMQEALKGMATGLVSGSLSACIAGQDENILLHMATGALQSICNYGMKNHMQFSNMYSEAIVYSACNAAFECVKKENVSLDFFLQAASGYATEKLQSALLDANTGDKGLLKNISEPGELRPEVEQQDNLFEKSSSSDTRKKETSVAPAEQNQGQQGQRDNENGERENRENNGDRVSVGKYLQKPSQSPLQRDLDLALQKWKAADNGMKGSSSDPAKKQPGVSGKTERDKKSSSVLKEQSYGASSLDPVMPVTGSKDAGPMPSSNSASSSAESNLALLRAQYGKQSRDILSQAQAQKWSDGAIEQALRGAYHPVKQAEEALVQSYAVTKEKATWVPMKGKSGIKTHTTRFSQDKRGQNHHRDTESGRYSKSAVDQALDSVRAGEMDSGLTAEGITYNLLPEHTQSPRGALYFDFGRTSVLGDPNIQSGGRAYFDADKPNATSTLTQNKTELSVSSGARFGINMASAQSESGNLRVDVDYLAGEASVSAEFAVDANGNKNSRFGVAASFKAVDVKSEAKLPTFCIQDSCYTASVSAEAAVGAGIEGGAGYKDFKTKPGGSYTMSAGAGAGAFFKGSVTVDVEPDEESSSPGYDNVKKSFKR